MKKTLLFIMAIALCTALTAQHKVNIANLKSVSAKSAHPYTVGAEQEAEADVVPFVSPTIMSSKAGENLTCIGETYYNLPTNSCARNLISFKPNSPYAAATWTMGGPSTPIRGTGINYYDYTTMTWDPIPDIDLGRIETIRTGWGTHGFTLNGEIVVSHDGLLDTTSGLVICTRDKWGEGEWNQYTLIGPHYPTNTDNIKRIQSSLIWPSVVTNGDVVHVVAVTEQGQEPPYGYLELSTVPLYYRSTDGGKTWDIKAHDFLSEGMTEYEADRVSGDNVVIAAKGDHVVILCEDSWQFLFYMESLDGGNSWAKKTVYTTDFLEETGIYEFPRIAPSTSTIFIDDKDKVHVVFGSIIHFRDEESQPGYHYIYREIPTGMYYWNDEYEQIHGDQLRLWWREEGGYLYIDSINYDKYPGYIRTPSVLGYDDLYFWDEGPGFNNSQFGYNGICSYPRIMTSNNNIYVSFQSIIDYPLFFDSEPANLYRGIFLTVSKDGGKTWDVENNTSWLSYREGMFEYDFTNYKGPYYDNDGSPLPPEQEEIPMLWQSENAYPTMSMNIYEKLLIVQWYNQLNPFVSENGHQKDKVYVYGFTKYLWEFPEYNNISKIYKGEVGVSEPKTTHNIKIYPNPANGTTKVDLDTNEQPYTLTVTNIMGQVVYSMNGHKNTVNLDVANYPAGIYIVNVKTANAISSQKLIVQ